MSGADPSSSRLRWPAVIVALSLALGALVVNTGVPVEAQQDGGDGNADLSVGIPVPYEALDGSESLTVTIDEIIDPFESGLSARDVDRLSTEERRYVALRVHVENAAATDLRYFFPNSIQLLDADTLLHKPKSVQRDKEARAADPKLASGKIAAGASVEGLLVYELAEAAEVEAVIFTPSSDRLITLSSRALQPTPAAAATDEPSEPEAPPSLQPTPAAVATDEPSEPGAPPSLRPTPAAAATVKPSEPGAPASLQPDLTELDATGSYDSAWFGHRARWDPALWSAVDALASPSHDHLALESDVVTISIDGIEDFDGDPERCLVDQVYRDLDEVVGFDGPPDDVLPPTADDQLPTDAGLYVISREDGGRSHDLVRYVECRTLLADKAVLRISITAPERSWAIERGIAGAVLSAIDLPVWAPDPGAAESLETDPSPSFDAGTVGADTAPEAEGPRVPAVDCDALLTMENADVALATWERIDAGLDGDTLGLSGGEACTTRLFSDESIFVRIEPGDAGDFEPGAEHLGAPGRPIPALGDKALLFHAADVGTDGQTILSVRERRDVGTLHVRLALGRPDLEEPERSLILARLARDVLPRFPGAKVHERPDLLDQIGLDLGGDETDRSHLTYVDNLLVKEEAGEWTRGEGLVATLKMFAGEAASEDVLRHSMNLDWEGTGILRMASRFLSEGTGDVEERTEITRLLDLLTYDDEELEVMAGITPASSVTARRSASAHIAVRPLPAMAGLGGVSMGTTLRQPTVRTAQALIVDCLEFFDEETWRGNEATGIGPCLEWRPANVPGPDLEEDKYRIFYAAAPLPQVGWTEAHFDTALTALKYSARWFESEGNRLARAAGAPGRMPPVNVVFAVADIGNTADAWPVERKPCGIRLGPVMQGLSAVTFSQIIAHELAHCHQAENFPDQYWLENSDWWAEGSADWLSNIIYPTANLEWDSWEYAEGFNLTTTLLDLSYGAFAFFQFLEWEIGREGIFRLFASLPIKGGKPEQERSLRNTHGAMDELFHDFVEALVDGSIQDSGGGRVPTPLELGQTVLDHPGPLTQDIEPFGLGRRHLLVKQCKRAHLQFGKAAIKTSARPQAEADWLDGWATQPTKIPTWPGDEHDRILVVTAVRAAQIDLEVTDVDDDPECEPDDPLAPSSEVLEFCDLGCEPSDYFPPLSPPVEFGDP